MSKTEVIFTNDISVNLVKWCGRDADIIQAARVSTVGADALPSAANTGLINYLMKNRHGSPFEHGLMTFLVTAPIFVWREHMRHRVGFSYNEESGRYKELDPIFYIPYHAREQKGKPSQYDIVVAPRLTSAMQNLMTETCREAYESYDTMLKAGVAREVARMILPVNIMSSAFVTCNPRSLMHFLSLRVDSGESTYRSNPQLEIQIVAEQYELHFSKLFPVTWEAFCKTGRVAP